MVLYEFNLKGILINLFIFLIAGSNGEACQGIFEEYEGDH